MALGKLCDQNLAVVGTLSGGSWSGALPLTNLQDDKQYLAAPARCLTPGTLSSSQFELALPKARVIDLVAVLFHTMSQAALYRVTLAADGGSLASPAYTSDWLPVAQRLFPSAVMPWEHPGWWLGVAEPVDLDLYPRHLWIALPGDIVVSAIRIEFDDRDNAAGYFDIGGLWVAAGWSPQFNFDWGSDLSLDARDQVDEGPSGRLFGEERRPRRRLQVTWSQLTEIETFRLFDAGARMRTTRSVLFVPDIEYQPGLVREAWPAVFDPPPSARKGRNYQGVVRAGLKEIIA